MMPDSDYSVEILMQGFPGKTGHHGSLGWNTVALLRGHGEVLLVDTGDHMYRQALRASLAERGLDPSDVTGVLVTHCHSDHMCNYPLFPRATVYVSEKDLKWAAEQPPATSFIPEFHVRDLLAREKVTLLGEDEEFLPQLRAVATPGHTPGHVAFVAGSAEASWIFCGDALKNEAELATGEVAATMDERASKASIERLRSIAKQSAANMIVPGHDRLLGLEDGQIVERAPLVATVTRKLSSGVDIAIDITTTP